MDFALQLLKVAGSLALVLGLFFAIIHGLKRWGGMVRKSSIQPSMEVVSKQSFGPRHHLLLVKIPGGQKVLVGISPQNMSLANLPETADTSAVGAKVDIS